HPVRPGRALPVGGVGLANQLGNGRQGALLISRFESVEIPVLSDIPVVGHALFDQDPVVYFAIAVWSAAGWVALAVVIFAAWRPFLVVLGALLFGAMTSLGFVAQARGWDI